jgi:nucleotide-binding universal stress UspA family protein
MSWRQIIAFADGAEDAIVRVEIAFALAREQAARLDAIVPALMPTPVYGTSLDLLSKGLAELRRECLREARAKAERLKSISAPDAGLHVWVEDVLEGEIRALAAARGRTGDLVVAGQPDALDRSTMDTDLFVGALLGSGRPCLMLPRWLDARPWGQRALIAWKGKPESARALSGALPLLRHAAEARLLIVDPGSAREGEDDKSLARIGDYLRTHGVNAAAPIIRAGTGAVERVVAAELESFGADLLVMGAYSRPRALEIIFGGLTAAMINEARIPVLFAH